MFARRGGIRSLLIFQAIHGGTSPERMAESPLALDRSAQPGPNVVGTQTIHQDPPALSEGRQGVAALRCRDGAVVLVRKFLGVARPRQHKPRGQRRPLRSSRAFESLLRAQYVGTSCCTFGSDVIANPRLVTSQRHSPLPRQTICHAHLHLRMALAYVVPTSSL